MHTFCGKMHFCFDLSSEDMAHAKPRYCCLHLLKGHWSIVSDCNFFIPMPDVIRVNVRSLVASNQTQLILLQRVGRVGKEGTAQMKIESSSPSPRTLFPS